MRRLFNVMYLTLFATLVLVFYAVFQVLAVPLVYAMLYPMPCWVWFKRGVCQGVHWLVTLGYAVCVMPWLPSVLTDLRSAILVLGEWLRVEGSDYLPSVPALSFTLIPLFLLSWALIGLAEMCVAERMARQLFKIPRGGDAP